MTVLKLAGLAKYWGAELLFKEVDLLVNEGEKVGLVGRNGSGKTTLLKLVLGRLEHDGGTVYLAPGSRVGYLSQDPEFTAGRTVLAEAESVFAHLHRWERDLRDLERRMSAAQGDEELQALLDQYARLTARYEHAGAYELSAKVNGVLFGLGFTESDLGKPVEVLSGGQKVRLGLARLLLEEPVLLLLDEPTNHLDLAATEWLETYLKGLKSAALLISHDRYFLDRVTTKTLELEDHTAPLAPRPLPLLRGGGAEACRPVFRRGAEPPDPGEANRLRCQRPAPRRAYEPSGPRVQGRPGGSPERVPRHPHLRLPRPLLRGSGGDGGLGVRTCGRHAVRGELHRLQGRAGAADGPSGGEGPLPAQAPRRRRSGAGQRGGAGQEAGSTPRRTGPARGGTGTLLADLERLYAEWEKLEG